MSMGQENTRRRFSPHMPFEQDDDPIVREITQLRQSREELYQEFIRQGEQLQEERQLREIEAKRADRAEADVRKLRDSNAFYRDQYVMAITEIGGLVATVNGMLVPMGQQVLGAFKNFHGSIEARTKKLTQMAQDHIAGTREFAAQQRHKRDVAESGQAEHDRLAGPMKNAISDKRADSFEAINQDMANLVRETNESLGQPHRAVNETIERRASRLQDLEEGRKPPPDPEDTTTVMQRIQNVISGGK